MRPRLTFRNDGTFTIVQFTDVHWQTGGEDDQRSRSLMDQVLEAEKPDLVVFTGDTIYGSGAHSPDIAFRDAIACADDRGIPWAAVFGNHDDEGAMSRAELMSVMTAQPWCLAEAGPDELGGVGNYVLRIAGADGADGADEAALVFLDSGSYAPKPIGGYAWVQPDQIAWFRQQTKELRNRQGSPIPMLAFFHIPLPEYAELWEEEVCYGVRQEPVCCPTYNSGLFQAFKENGNVLGAFVGHDHVNDYWGERDGIRLCYGRATGFHTYGKEGFARGARMIRLSQGEQSFRTWLRLEGGEVVWEQPAHVPERSGGAESAGSASR